MARTPIEKRRKPALLMVYRVEQWPDDDHGYGSATQYLAVVAWRLRTA
jgi:hypothetical protein